MKSSSRFLQNLREWKRRQEQTLRRHNDLVREANDPEHSNVRALLESYYADDVKALVMWHGIMDRGSKQANIQALLHNVKVYNRVTR
jgi:hypothetical protein